MTYPFRPRQQAMTDEERSGFRKACRTMQMWGAQLEAATVSLAGDTALIPRHELQARSGRMMTEFAAALEDTAS